MRKILLLVCVLAMVLPLTGEVLAQTAKEPAAAAALFPNLGDYRLSSLGASEEMMRTNAFLKEVNSESKISTDSPANKMGLGIMNTATFWADLPLQVARESGEHNLLMGATVGLGKGVISSVARGASGVIDIATCGFPPYDKPLMQPEYKVEQPNKGFKIKLLQW